MSPLVPHEGNHSVARGKLVGPLLLAWFELICKCRNELDGYSFWDSFPRSSNGPRVSHTPSQLKDFHPILLKGDV